MRRSPTLAIILIVAFAVFPVTLAACGGDDDDGDGGAGNGGGNGAGAEPASDYRVAMLATGALNNRSWANAWANGAERAQEEFGIELEMVGSVDAPDQYLSQGSAFASEGYDLLIFANGAPREQAIRVARQFPETNVVMVFQPESKEQQTSEDPPNLGYVDPEQQYGTFLAGVLAGMVTETGTVGSVYAFPFPALTRQPEGYELGARCVNPEVNTVQRRSDSFTDAAAARAAASALIDDDADVILSAVDQAVQGVIQAASQAQQRDNQVYAIASYFDSNDLNPEAVLTSVLYNLEGVAYEVIERGVNDELGDHFFESYTFANLEVGDLAPLYEQEELVGEENIDRLEQIRGMVADETIVLPDETVSNPDIAGGATIGAPGSAAEIDVADLGCTDEFRAELGL